MEEGLGEGMWDWSEEIAICEGCGVETIVGDYWETTAKKFWNTVCDLLGEGGWVWGMGTIHELKGPMTRFRAKLLLEKIHTYIISKGIHNGTEITSNP